MSELQVLVDQLGELLAEGVDDAEDAFEIAVCAGLAARLDDRHPAVVQAAAWRDGAGADLLREAFEEIDMQEILDGIDGVLSGTASDEDVEDAVYELDDVVAAAVWCNRRDVVRKPAIEAARTIRDVPDTFAMLADFGREMARSRSVAENLDVYEYWLAIADTAHIAEAGSEKEPG